MDLETFSRKWDDHIIKNKDEELKYLSDVRSWLTEELKDIGFSVKFERAIVDRNTGRHIQTGTIYKKRKKVAEIQYRVPTHIVLQLNTGENACYLVLDKDYAIPEALYDIPEVVMYSV